MQNEDTADGVQNDHDAHEEHNQEQTEAIHENRTHAYVSTTTEVIPPRVLWEHNGEIQILREYLRIPTPHPDIDYSKQDLLKNYKNAMNYKIFSN